ncbi:hypothetical protein CHS0354_034431 [Potamilus streckersoni]|uniref:Inosine/uridine-preferring nucleoside hydrolase domain-containing protein n=1 Tax=Potamilus streckersoni TaxID=2493646 RepID=A0AAE0VSC7_9BIVA|nr:hypothetical protein CHS0354_034431 [Potamilus streckersoni]
MKRKFLIDVDTGVDDAQALMLALSIPDIEVMGITCVSGNVDIDQVCRNTLKVLSVCNRLDIPVYRGSSKSLVGKVLQAAHYHGSDGLGDSGLAKDMDLGLLQRECAAVAIVNLVNKYPGEITLVALAPLTNVALSLRLDPGFGNKLKEVFIMGGNTEAKGRVSPCAEFNFLSDPESASVTLQELRNIVVFPYELSFSCGMSWNWFDEWISQNTPKAQFNQAISHAIVHKQRVEKKSPFYRSCDLTAMALAVDKSLAIDTESVYATVELSGTLTRGQMVVDWNGCLRKPPNVTLVKKVNVDKARQMYNQMIK